MENFKEKLDELACFRTTGIIMLEQATSFLRKFYRFISVMLHSTRPWLHKSKSNHWADVLELELKILLAPRDFVGTTTFLSRQVLLH